MQLLMTLLAVSSITLFAFSLKVNGLNRIVTHIPIQVFHKTIPLVSDEEEIDLYYDKYHLQDNVKHYLDTSIYKYVSSYDIDYYFYNTDSGGACDITDCKGVEITITAKVSSFYTYKKTMYYEIRSALNE